MRETHVPSEQKGKLRSKWKILTLVITVIILLSSAIFYYSYKVGERETAVKLLNAFYTFDLNTVAKNDEEIFKLTTTEVYESHTIASSMRQLRVYLKFEGNPTEAKILKHEGNTIYYYIKAEGFDEERTFAMKYHYKYGKIDKIAEYEVYFLPNSDREEL